MTPPPILPSSLAVGDRVEWTTGTGERARGTVAELFRGACAIERTLQHFSVMLYDDRAARLAIKIVRRVTG